LVTAMQVRQESHSRLDSTRKFLMQLADDQSVEAVYMEFEGRNTVCISTQVGCAVGCPFCATGRMGLRRNLEPGEIIGQLHLLRHQLKLSFTNVVFMGMGEPFHNYEAVMQALAIMTDPEGYGLSARRITVSTAGVAPRIREFAEAPVKAKLAVSLSSPRDAVRNKLVPLNRRYPLAELFDALHYYAARTRHRITFEYVLLRGINDSAADAKLLRSLLGQLPAKLNLIVYNTTGEEYASATREDFIPFYERFLDAPFPVTFRENRGGDIDAACGQLWTRSVS
ncbi:MAG: 23S rRNA (adenine(2503)-C(2))-methyltransferase RlmN, partial [Candidatus Delongbacteria bacterium]|nr:23S rRNA (adenine(2503)-C(2))-methyltransferase RlmN [Candidatus Delongbacteria bacterium]